jgi:hypothetical protein
MNGQLARRAITPVLVGLAALAGMLALAHATRHGAGIAPDSASYLEAARNLAAGHGVSTSEDGVSLLPLTRFPPLYPAAIAAIAKLGADPLDAARWLGIVLLGANSVLAGLLVARCAPGARWLPVVGAVLMASSPDVVVIHGAVLSEPLFLFLGFSGLLFLSLHLETRQPRWLLAASFLVALACLTRFVGPSLVATGALALLFFPGARPRRRALDAAAFAAIALLPVCFWTLRNQLLAGEATRRSFAFHPIEGDAFRLALRSVGGWLLAGQLGEVAAWLLGAVLLLCVLRWLARGAPRAGAAAMPRILLWFVPMYLVLLLASISFFDAATPLNSRILSPLLVALLVLAVCGAHAAARGWRSPAPAILAALMALVFTFCFARDTREWIRERAATGGVGFGSLAWRESETMRRVSELPADALVYSNARDAIYALTGRGSRWIPAWVDAETRQPRPDYLAELEEIRAGLRAGNASLVWFDRIDWRWYLPSRPALSQQLPILQVSQLRDGEIWGYDPARDAPGAR